MIKTAREYFVMMALVFIIVFYWVGKEPDKFQGIRIPDFSFFILMLFAVAGLVQYIKLKYKLKWYELLFTALLLVVPIFGNIAEIILYAKESSAWLNFVDIDLMKANKLLGFRSPMLVDMIFLFSARYMATALGEKKFRIAVIVGAVPHAIWGIAQSLYMFIPSFLEGMPITVGNLCGEGEFCLSVDRAQGLMVTAFPYSWFFMVVGFSLNMISRSNAAVVTSLLLSALSISRSFILASSPLFAYCLMKGIMKGKFMLFFSFLFVTTLGVTFADKIQMVIERRFEGDISRDVRAATNLLSFDEILRGNVLGIGYSNAYYTDSTVANLLLNSGVPGLATYLIGWAIFFRLLWFVSGKRAEVLLFGGAFFFSSFLVGVVEAEPGLLILFILYWLLRNRQFSEANINIYREKHNSLLSTFP